MSIINSFFIALSMYSRIPVPRVDWEKENMRYAHVLFSHDWSCHRGSYVSGRLAAG